MPICFLGGQAGAVDEESFIAAFEEVKRVNIFNARGLTDEITKIRETLSKSSNDWKIRIEALQMLRSLLIAGAANYDELHNLMRTLDVPFQTSVKDLRSQVGRNRNTFFPTVTLIGIYFRSFGKLASQLHTFRSS